MIIFDLIIGFTGTREGMTTTQRRTVTTVINSLVLLSKNKTRFHHGDCKGSDEQADYIARKFGCSMHIHPPDDDKHRAYCGKKDDVFYPEKPYLVRDKDIVEEIDVLIAAPLETKRKKGGTWYTIKQAKEKDVPIIIIDNEGNFYNE